MPDSATPPNECLFDEADVAELTSPQRVELAIALLNRAGIKGLSTSALATLAGVSLSTVQEIYSTSLAKARLSAAQLQPNP